jgi:hypothetical protein
VVGARRRAGDCAARRTPWREASPGHEREALSGRLAGATRRDSVPADARTARASRNGFSRGASVAPECPAPRATSLCPRAGGSWSEQEDALPSVHAHWHMSWSRAPAIRPPAAGPRSRRSARTSSRTRSPWPCGEGRIVSELAYEPNFSPSERDRQIRDRPSAARPGSACAPPRPAGPLRLSEALVEPSHRRGPDGGPDSPPASSRTGPIMHGTTNAQATDFRDTPHRTRRCSEGTGRRSGRPPQFHPRAAAS